MDNSLKTSCEQITWGISTDMGIILKRALREIDTSLLNFVRSEVFTAVAMKNGVFWDVTPYGSCKNRRFGGT
jgi:hypothetical protein